MLGYFNGNGHKNQYARWILSLKIKRVNFGHRFLKPWFLIPYVSQFQE